MILRPAVRFIKKITGVVLSKTRTGNATRQIVRSLMLRAISIIINLAYVPLLLKYLNQEKYGIWLALTSIIGWFSFFDIGLGNGLRNKLTQSIAAMDQSLSRKYVSTTYFLLIAIFVPLLITFHLVNRHINWNIVLNAPNIESSELENLSAVVFSFFIARFVTQLISVIYLANQKSSFSDLISTLGNLFAFLTVLLLPYISKASNLVLLGLIVSGIPVILFIFASIHAFFGKYRFLRPSIRFVDLKYGRSLFSLGSKFFLLQICAIVVFSTSSFFITQFYGPAEVAIYNIVFRLFQVPIMLYSIVLSPMWSAVTDAYVKQDFNWLKKTIKQLNILSIIFTIGIVFVFLLSNRIYKLWVGESIEIPLSLSLIMALFAISNVFLAPYSAFLNGTSKIELTTKFTGIGIVVYFCLVYVFGHSFSDSTGIVLAVLCTSLIGLVIQPIQAHKLINGDANGIWNK